MSLTLLGILGPAVLSLVPDLARLLVGPKAADVASKTVEVVQAFTGTTDVTSAEAALKNLPPEQRMHLQIELAKIAATEAEQERRAEFEQARISLENTINARTQTIELAKMGSSLAWMPALQSFIVSGLFGFTLVILLLDLGGVARVADGFRDILIALVGALTVEFRGVCQYWIGGSRAGGMAATMGLRTMSGPTTQPDSVTTQPGARRSLFGGRS